MFGDVSFFELPRENFPVSKWELRLWRRWGKYYRKSREFKLLKQIEADRTALALESPDQQANLYWLLPYRTRFRRVFSICRQGDVGAIRYYMAYCPGHMIPICIWLISKCADRFRLYGISEFCRDPSPQVRKHAAKALRRLEAWWLLEEMATLYPEDSSIRWFANAPVSHRPFAERLSSFMRSVDDSHAGEVATPSRMTFWRAERDWERHEPKSVWYIRVMLQRIRRWVRGV